MFASKDELFTRPSGGYTIARSVRLRSSASAYFNRTPAGAGNRTTWTWSAWIKLGKTTGYQYFFGATSDNYANNFTLLQMNNGTSDLAFYDVQGGATKFDLRPTQLFRDPSAWYHLVLVYDSSNATSSDRVRMYVNGSRITAFSSATYPTSSQTSVVNSVTTHNISTSPYGVDGYLTEINFIDGQALTPSSFGSTNAITGVWQPAKYTGTYGTNGFYLNFSDNSNNTATTIGKDYSGNSNNWTPNNISVTAGATYDSMTDVPTLTSATTANYAVLNPLATSGTSITLSNGNLYATYAAAGWATAESTMAMNASGKYYFEFTKTDTSSQMVGIMPFTGSTTSFVGNDANGYGYFSANGYLYNNAGGSITFGATWTNGDVIGIAFDASTGKLWFSKNNTWQASGDPSAGTSPAATASTAYTYVAGFSTNGSGVGTVNFGQRPFTYTPPTGYVALNTYNLPASTITNGAAYMAATLYSGNASTQSITNTVNGVSFQPDFVWAKARNNAFSHKLFDSVRGIYQKLSSESTSAEATETAQLTAFNSNGFTLGNDNGINGSGSTFVGWQWKAGTTSASNTNGSITSTVSVGATQGFSVVTYTGTGANATVGHGLGVAPSMVIVKVRNAVDGWFVYNKEIGNTKYLRLNTTDAASTFNLWQNTSPTSSVFSIATDPTVNYSGYTYVAYCFSAVAGYSAFGSFVANGSADGPFVHLGFRPRFVMFKDATTAGGYWEIHDTSRSTYNATTARLWPNVSSAEATGADIDFLSNGFKVRTTDGTVNNSGSTVIYMAFAESPFKFANAR